VLTHTHTHTQKEEEEGFSMFKADNHRILSSLTRGTVWAIQSDS